MADNDVVAPETPDTEAEAPKVPRPKAPPIDSRFLFVDVAAMRAKQLRRGAIPRLSEDDEAAGVHRPTPFKAERLAMEEVRRGLVQYEITPYVKPAER